MVSLTRPRKLIRVGNDVLVSVTILEPALYVKTKIVLLATPFAARAQFDPLATGHAELRQELQ